MKCAEKAVSTSTARRSAVRVSGLLAASFIPLLFRRDGARDEEGRCCGELASAGDLENPALFLAALHGELLRLRPQR